MKRTKRTVPTRVLATFVLAVALPALVLAVAGFRMAGQERRAAEAEALRSLNEAARHAASEFRQELDWWQQRTNEIEAGNVPLDLASAPRRLREALTEPGQAVLVSIAGRRATGVRPPGQVLHLPGPPIGSFDPPASVLAADTTARLAASALDSYRGSLDSSRSPVERAWLLQRVARQADADGLDAVARRAYEELSRSRDVALGALPADLVGHWGLCSVTQRSEPQTKAAETTLRFYESLLTGTWQIEKTRFLFYASQAGEYLARSPAGLERRLADLSRHERTRQPLTEAVEELVRTLHGNTARPGAVRVSGRVSLVFWRADSSSSQAGLALVMSPDFVTSAVVPSAFSSSRLGGTVLSVEDGSGNTVFAAANGRPNSLDSAVSLEIPVLGESWRLEAWPSDPASFTREVDRRHRFSLAMLVLMVTSIGFGVVTSVRTLRKELEVARIKSDFASTVSHEFRSPLTGIRQLTEMLAAGRVATEQRKGEYYAMILEEVSRLSAMVEDVLAMARLRDREGAGRAEAVRTAQWLQEVVDRFRHSPAAAGATIESSIPDTLPRLVVDRDGVERAVSNLLDNAIKYSPGSKKVWVEAEPEAGAILIRVRDEGAGIDPADQLHVFERFYRGKSDVSGGVRGSGLGLKLVKDVAAAHHGDVSVESRPGEGSTFTLRIGGIS